jgi:hypothetical protein
MGVYVERKEENNAETNQYLDWFDTHNFFPLYFIFLLSATNF